MKKTTKQIEDLLMHANKMADLITTIQHEKIMGVVVSSGTIPADQFAGVTDDIKCKLIDYIEIKRELSIAKIFDLLREMDIKDVAGAGAEIKLKDPYLDDAGANVSINFIGNPIKKRFEDE